jgi:predicted transposase/invertase (TIGR01784 family)
MRAAIEYCIKNDILKRFLERNSEEIINMLITEWDTEEAKEVWYEEGVEDGIEKGIEKGIAEGISRTAAAFKKMGLSVERISEATGLPPEKIALL